MGAISRILNFDKIYNITYVACHNTQLSEEEFKNIVINSDVIITQLINDDYRNMQYLSTKYVVNNRKKNSKLILCDNCYFTFYYPDLKYYKHNGEMISAPNDYHYDTVLKCYKDNISIEGCLDKINDENLFTCDEIEKLAQNSFTELEKRSCDHREYLKYENVYYVQICGYIKENYKDKLLFYSMNHPSNHLLQYMCENILNILQMTNTMNYNLDPLDRTKCILYKCVQKHLNFKLKQIDNIKDIIKTYHDTYRKYNI